MSLRCPAPRRWPNYQAALRSVTYSDSNGTNPTTGTRTISFQVNDGDSSNNLSNAVSRSVQVSPNPPPVASDDSATTNKNTAIDISVLANDSDSDGDGIHVASVDTTGTKGSVSINPDGTIHYDPNGQFSGLQAGQSATDTFTYEASDGFHNSNSATVTVTVTGVNDPPVLSNIEASTIQYDAGTPPVQVTTTLTVTSPHGHDDPGRRDGGDQLGGLTSSEDVLAFTKQNGITGSYNSSTGVLSLTGTASVADYQAALRSVTYSDPNGTNPATGPRSISFQVDDGASSNNLSNVVSRTVNVTPNSPPVAGDVSASTDKHTAIDVNVLASASDPDGDPVTLDRGRHDRHLGVGFDQPQRDGPLRPQRPVHRPDPGTDRDRHVWLHGLRRLPYRLGDGHGHGHRGQRPAGDLRTSRRPRSATGRRTRPFRSRAR